MDKGVEVANGITNLNLLQQRMRSQSAKVSFSKSLPQLKFLLQKDNLKFHYPLQVIERCCYHLSQKGVNLANLQQSIRDVNVQGIMPDGTKTTENCYFYVKDLTLNSIAQLLQKAHQYSVFNNIQVQMNDYESINSKSLYLDNRLPMKLPSTFRNDNKFKQYHQIVSSIVTTFISGEVMTAIEILRLFYHASKNDFWELIMKIFEGVDFQTSNRNIKEQLIQNSLRILQQQFSQRLPKDIVSLEMFVKGEQINKLAYGKSYVHFDSRGRPIWALIYILLRAGRVLDIKAMQATFNDRSFFRDINSYLAGQNKTYRLDEDSKDVFLEAIYSIFNRKPACAHQIFLDQKDYLWFALKTVSIHNFQDAEFTLAELQVQIGKRFDLNPTNENFKTLVLTLNFDKVIQTSPFVDSDDIGHFLLFLYMLRLDQQGFLTQNTREQFQQKMNSYAQELIRTDICTAIDYIILCFNKKSNPTLSVLSMITDLLIYTSSVQRFFGDPPTAGTPIQQRIQKALVPSRQEYQSFISKTMDMYVGRSKNYLYPAKVYEYVMGNTTKSVQYLLGVLVKDVLGQRVFDENQVKEAVRLIERIQGQKQITSTYSRLLEFIQLTKQIKDIVVQDRPIDPCIFSSKYFPKKGPVSQKTHQILLDLNLAKWLGVYAIFLFYSLKLVQRYYSFKTNKMKQYSQQVSSIKNYYRELKENGMAKDAGVFFKQKIGEIQKELEMIGS